MYVPTGFLILECVAPTQALTYGVRKSFFLKGKATSSSYNVSKDFLSLGGKDVSMMTKILGVIDKQS